jgi:hypothetical protein
MAFWRWAVCRRCYGTDVTNPGSPQIMVGDVWDALEAASFQVTSVATGRRLLTGPAEQTIFLHGRELVGGLVAATSLVVLLASWGITPVASGNYAPPPNADAAYLQPYSALPQGPKAA